MTLPPSAMGAFRLAAGELGMCSAARLFTAELLEAGGVAMLEEARDTIGPAFPVLEVVASDLLAERAALAPIDVRPAVRGLGSADPVLVVGLEAYHMDALVEALPGRRIGLLLEEGGLSGDRRRVLANFGGRVEDVRMSDVQRWAGRRSALLTFVYGTHGTVAYVLPAWLRVAGPDTRPQFRALVGWDVLGRPTSLYPRWLVEAPTDAFSEIVGD